MLKTRARAAVFWSGLEIFTSKGVSFVVTVILARLLVPEDFGTLALLALFLGIANLFVTAGFAAALIQKQDVTHLDESTMFWFNVAAALVMWLVLFALSPLIADFFALPVLQPLTVLVACTIVLSASGAIHSTLLSKRLDFRAKMKVGLISTAVSGGVGVYLAWNNFGVWALAWQAVVSAAISTLLLWAISSWRPLYAFSSDSFRRLFGFGGWLAGAYLLDTIYQKGYTLLIGKFYGTYDLGIYNRADNTQQLPTSILTGVLSRVAFPLFSSVNQDKERLRRGVQLSVRSIALITSPVMIGLSVLAEPFIRVVFGEQWLPAVPILQVLCVLGLLWPLHVINLNVLKAQGHANLFFRLAVIKKIAGIVLLVTGSFFGILGIAWGRVIQSIIAVLINSHYTKKFLGYGIAEQTKDCFPSFLLGAGMGSVVLAASHSIDMVGKIELLLLIFLGALFYVLGNLALGASAFKEAILFARGRV